MVPESIWLQALNSHALTARMATTRIAIAWATATTDASMPEKTSGNGPTGTRETGLPTILI